MDTTDFLTKLYTQYRFSDLHLHTNEPPMVRIDGDITRAEMPALSAEDLKALLGQLMTKKQLEDFEKRLELDFSFSIENVCRFRANVYYQLGQLAAVFRVIPFVVKTIDDLNLPPVLRTIALKRQGLVLVTGQKGSGKSTTLAAMLEYLNTKVKKHISTIEDPIEFVYKNKNCVFSQRQVETDTRSFANALRATFREDTDILLVGEIRDLETMRLALTAAETGQLVLSTLHTANAASTVNRMIDFFSGKERNIIRKQISTLLLAVISQTLIKKRTGGRVLAHEIMIATPAIRNLIREDNATEMRATMEADRELGMHTLDQHLQQLVKDDVITQATAQQYMAGDERLSVSYQKEIV